jgi:hypothetical protein
LLAGVGTLFEDAARVGLEGGATRLLDGRVVASLRLETRCAGMQQRGRG